MAESEDLAIGIDLGTTYSCVAVWRGGQVEIISNEHGNRTTPSYVAFTDHGRLFGDAAKNQVAMTPTNTIFDAKRLIGRRFSDPLVQRDMMLWPFKVVSDANDDPKLVVEYKGEVQRFAPEEISAMVLNKLRETAEAYLGTKVKNAVITVPAYFSDAQRRATKDAGVIAGLNVLRIINEPMAAAIAYGLDKEATKYGKKNVLVFDLGGGTFDVCLVTLDADEFIVKAVAGNNHLGGEDFDDMMVNYFIQVLKKKYDKDIRSNPRAMRRLRTECEKAKIYLTTSVVTHIDIDALVDNMDFQYTMSREEFEHLNKFLFHTCIESVEKCLRDAKMEKVDINEIVLVGGSTRIPYVQKMLETFFEGKKLCRSLNPDEAIAYGAAIHAAMLSKNESQKLRTPPKCSEVIPLSLGINVEGDVMEVLIPRNTPIPTQIERTCTTVDDYQKVVSIQILEGEGTRLEDNDLLGQFDLLVLSLVPKGVPRIKVCFEIDANGILNVTAKDARTGLENKIIITKDRSKLSAKRVENVIKQVGRFNIDEKEYKDQMIAKNTLENHIYNLECLIKEEKISLEEKTTIKDAINRATEWKERNIVATASEYNSSVEELKSLKERIFRGRIDVSATYVAGHEQDLNINLKGTTLRMVTENEHESYAEGTALRLLTEINE